MLAELPEEIIFKEICRYLNDRSKLNLHSTCKRLYFMKTYLTLDDSVEDFEDIVDSVYFNNFSKVRYSNATFFMKPIRALTQMMPLNLREIHLPNSKVVKRIYKKTFKKVRRIEHVHISLVTIDLSFLRGIKSISIDTIKIVKSINIPDTVERLIIECKNMENVRKKIKLILPESLRVLKIKDISKFDTELLSKYFVTNSCIQNLYLDSKGKSLGINSLPNNLKKFYINKPLNTTSSSCYLKEYPIEKLTLGNLYNSLIELPNKLKILKVGNLFNKPLNLPDSIQVLDLGSSFNQDLDLRNLKQLKILRLGYSFNRDIVITSESLIELELGKNFRKKIYFNSNSGFSSEFYIPSSLKKLSILCKLPFRIIKFSSLEHLELHDYKYPIPEFPSTLRSLKLCNIDINIDSLPDSIEDLSITNFTFSYRNRAYTISQRSLSGMQQISSYLILPKKLMRLYIHDYDAILIDIPDTLISLTVQGSIELRFNEFPKKLRIIDLSGNTHPFLPKLHDEIIGLRLSKTFKDSLELPREVRILSFGREFNQNIAQFPKNLEYLEFGDKFNMPIPELPSSLKGLSFGQCFNFDLPPLPPNLQYLKLGKSFNKAIIELPSKLKYLELRDFEYELPILPDSIRTLKLGRYRGILKNIPKNLQYIEISNPPVGLPKNVTLIRVL
jgi:hypothetical protein